MLRVLGITLMLGALSGCGCALDPGDSTKTGEYWDGCWSAAKDNRHGTTLLPHP